MREGGGLIRRDDTSSMLQILCANDVGSDTHSIASHIKIIDGIKQSDE